MARTGRIGRTVRSKSWQVAGVLTVLAGGGVAAIAAGCGGNDAESGVSQSKLPEGMHVETIDHEACGESGHRVESLDTNNDGKPDIKRVYDLKTGKEVCRITDLDHDGKPDLYEYYDANGSLRRREAAYDSSGVVVSVETFENGKLAKRELDTTGQHRVDTWDYFDPVTGKLARRERDSTNDGRVDQWWTFDGDKVTIAIDKNGDGRPDPGNVVTLGGSSDDTAPKPAAPAVVDSGAPAAPAAYVPAGMDAGDLATPLVSATASASLDAGSASDAKAPAAKGKAAKGSKK